MLIFSKIIQFVKNQYVSLKNGWDMLAAHEKLLVQGLLLLVCVGGPFLIKSSYELFEKVQQLPKVEHVNKALNWDLSKIRTSKLSLIDEAKKMETLYGSRSQFKLIKIRNGQDSLFWPEMQHLAFLELPDKTYIASWSPTPLEEARVKKILGGENDDYVERLESISYEYLSKDERKTMDAIMYNLGFEPKLSMLGALFANMVSILTTLLLIYFMYTMLYTNKKTLRFHKPSNLKGDLDDLIGMEDIKSELLQIEDFIKNKTTYNDYGITKAVNILFSGPPGTGKTKLAGHFAKRLNLPILFHSAANLETGYVNGGGKTLDQVMRLAKKQKRCIIFLDEAQDLFMKRGGGRKFDDDTQNHLLALLDGVSTNRETEIIWIVASNFNTENMEMDEAMLRRFPLKIDFRLPNAQERSLILKHYLSKAEGKLSPGINTDNIVHMTDGRSPADLEEIVRSVAMTCASARTVITSTALMQATERYLIGNTDVETTQDRTKERELIAIHEVGHFLMEALQHCENDITKVKRALPHMRSIKISLKANARSGALGFVLLKPSENLLMTQRSVEWRIKSLYAGMINEELFFGKEGSSNGGSMDIKEASKLLGEMVCKAGMFKDTKMDWSAAVFNESGQLDKEDKELIRSLSNQFWNASLEHLRPLMSLSRSIADTLLNNVEMSSEEIVEHIEKYLDN